MHNRKFIPYLHLVKNVLKLHVTRVKRDISIPVCPRKNGFLKLLPNIITTDLCHVPKFALCYMIKDFSIPTNFLTSEYMKQCLL